MISDLTDGYILDGKYQIHEKIGEGGMAFVFRAVNLETDEFVAIKVLKEEFCYDDEFIKRFKNEALAAQRLSHPNIVSIFEMGNDNDIQYIVMEYIDGITLDKLIKAKKKLPWRNTLQITAQILSAVEHAHQNDIIHRDIKPLNIMITEDGIVKLNDFGIARAVSSATKSASNDSAGSVHYLSPEQVRGGFVDKRTDIYSIGITMYEMITGSVPYDGESHVSIALKHIDGRITPPRDLDPKLPYGVSDLIVLATKKETNMRFQSAGEMYEQLLKVQKNPYVSFLSEYEEKEIVPPMPGTTDINEAEETNIAEDETILNQNGESVIEEYGIAEEKNAMVRDVVMQTITYLVSVIAAILVMFFVISQYYSVKNNFKNYNIVKYEAEEYIGMLASTVKETLEAKGIKVEQVLEENEEYPSGYIIQQSVKSGDMLEKNDKIVLTVSKKDGDFILDDYTGQSFQPVGTELMTKNLKVEYKQLYSAKYSDGKIIRTSPAPGTILEEGSKVTIYYSSGPLYRTVSVPNLYGYTLEEAERELSRVNIGLKVGVIYPSPSSQINHLLPTSTPTPTQTETADNTGLPAGETPDINTPTDNIDNTNDIQPTEEITAGNTEGSSTDNIGEPTIPTAKPTDAIYASDRVVAQYPLPGTQLMVNETVNLYFYDINLIQPKKTLTLDYPIAPKDPNAPEMPTMGPSDSSIPVTTPIITGESCSVKIEALMGDGSKRAEIVYMQPVIERDKFPIEYQVPVAVNGAPTKVSIYFGEVGGTMKLYKTIYVYG